jgi:hypothetical protein
LCGLLRRLRFDTRGPGTHPKFCTDFNAMRSRLYCAVDGAASIRKSFGGARTGATMVDFGGFTAEVFSGVAVAVSCYNFWHTSLRQAVLRAFVPPVMRYASPYQNSIFEVFEVPVTIVNEGARTGTVLSLNLQVTNAKGISKHFYSAGLGSWSMGRFAARGWPHSRQSPCQGAPRTPKSSSFMRVRTPPFRRSPRRRAATGSR